MPESKGETVNKGRWKKGQSGNPGGRPKMEEGIREACREFTRKGYEILRNIAEDPAAKDSDRIRCVEIIFDRGWGKPAQSVELETKSIPQVVFIGADNIPE